MIKIIHLLIHNLCKFIEWKRHASNLRGTHTRLIISFARPVVSGEETGGASAPNNLLKFVDFVSEKGCKSQGRRNEDSNSYIFEEATRIYQQSNISCCHTSQKF